MTQLRYQPAKKVRSTVHWRRVLAPLTTVLALVAGLAIAISALAGRAMADPVASITLVADDPAPVAGGTVTLTATTNYSYQTSLLIFDTANTSPGMFVAHCNYGLTCSFTTSSYTTPGPHSYVAEFSDSPDPSITSNIVTVTVPQPYTVSLGVLNPNPKPGATTELYAKASFPGGVAPVYYSLQVVEQATGYLVANCNGAALVCTYRTPANMEPGPVAYVAKFGPVTSDPVTVNYPQSLLPVISADSTAPAAGTFATIWAKVNQSLYNGSNVEIIEPATSSTLASCDVGFTCSITTAGLDPGVHVLVAKHGSLQSAGLSISVPAGTATTPATSGPGTWSVGLAISNATFAAGSTATLTATTNQDVAGTPYSIWLRDLTANTVVAECAIGNTCTADVSFPEVGSHEYAASVGYPGADEQAASSTVTATLKTWTLNLSQASTLENGAKIRIDLTATTDQDLGPTDYSVFFVDYTNPGQPVPTSCGTGTVCKTHLVVPVDRASDAYIAELVVRLPWQSGQVMMLSNAVIAPSGTALTLAETTGGANPSLKNCQCSHKDPVNTATGELFENLTDIGLPGSGPLLAVSRSYSSNNSAIDGPFGYGWSPSFQTHLHTVTAGYPSPRQVQIVQENGSGAFFSATPTGDYVAQPRVMAKLSYNGTSQQWTFVRKGKQATTFDSNGTLVSETDLHGNLVTYGYDSSGRVTTIQQSGGRTLTLTWTGSLVTKVSDSAGRAVLYGYDASDNLTSVTAVDGSVTTFGYDGSHYLTILTRPGGGSTTTAYDAQHRVSSQSDPMNRLTSFSYDGSSTTMTEPDGSITVETYDAYNRLASQTLAAGTSIARTISYSYDDANNVTATVDPLGKTTHSTYDGAGNKLTSTDPLGNVTSHGYDSLNDLVSVTDPLHRHATAIYNSAGDRLSATSPSGRVQHWTYNSDGTVATYVDARGQTTSYGYTATGQLSTSEDPDHRTSAIGYNPAGFVSSTTDSAGKVTQFTVDSAGRVLTATDPDLHQTSYTYDLDGNRLATEDANHHTTSATYDLADELTSTTNANGKTTSFDYTLGGYLHTVTDPNGHSASYGYDLLGQKTTMTDADNRATHYSYDADGRPQSTTTPAGSVTSTAYDDSGRRTSSTDPNGKTTTFGYDDAGELTSTTDPLSRETTRTYTDNGQLSVLTQPGGSHETYLYNDNGQQTDTTNFDGKHTTFDYDDAGLLTGKTEPGSQHTGYSYDLAGRLSVETLPDLFTRTYTYSDGGRPTSVHSSVAGSTDTSYGYDAVGQRTSMTDTTGTSHYVWDAAGQLTSESNGAGATIGYSYDYAGQLTGIEYPGSRSISYGYDATGQLTSLTDWASHTFSFGYTDDSQLRTQADPNGVVQTRSYDLAGQLTSLTTKLGTTSLASFSYGYDAAGQLTTDTVPTGGASGTTDHTYGYDLTSQLSTVTSNPSGGTTGSGSYQASPAGSLTGSPAGDVLAYNGAQELTTLTLATGPASSFGYDDNGSRISSTVAASGTTPSATTTYSYSPDQALASVHTPSATVSYTSDGAGLRQSRAQAGSTSQFTWSTQGSLPLLLDDGGHSYLYGPGSVPVAQVDDSTGAIEYLHSDNIGSVRLITDSSGSVTGTSVYDSYGNRTSPTGSADSTIGYSGNWTDPTTGLVYLRARDYDPATGQFLTVDPLVDTTRQPYAYVADDPLNAVDPSGLCWSGFGSVCHAASNANDGLYNTLTHGTGAHIVSAIEGFGDGASDGLTGKVDEALSPGSTCTYAHDGYFVGGHWTGVASVTIITGGDGTTEELLTGTERAAETGNAARLGETVSPLGRTYENFGTYLTDVADNYGINLRGVKPAWDYELGPGVKGLTRASEGGWIIRINPGFANEADLANTLAHELSHARDFQKGLSSLEDPAYASGDALEAWINGLR